MLMQHVGVVSIGYNRTTDITLYTCYHFYYDSHLNNGIAASFAGYPSTEP